MSRPSKPKESRLWTSFRQAISTSPKKWTTTRIETWATPGVPDILLCDEAGGFHFVELKTTAGQAVDLSPHQVAWHTRHAHASVWVLIEQAAASDRPRALHLYHGRDAVSLRTDGLRHPAAGSWSWPVAWDEILALICRS